MGVRWSLKRMGWNYRIIEHEDRFGLHMVHYTEDGSLQSFRPEPAFVRDKNGSMEEVLEMTKATANRPVLRYAELPFGPRSARIASEVVLVASGQ
jgi:hypothetical protein